MEKHFRKNEEIFVVRGKYEGDDGVVTLNEPTSVFVLLKTRKEVSLPKRDVYHKVDIKTKYENEVRRKRGELVKIDSMVGIIERVMKNYVEIFIFCYS